LTELDAVSLELQQHGQWLVLTIQAKASHNPAISNYPNKNNNNNNYNNMQICEACSQ